MVTGPPLCERSTRTPHASRTLEPRLCLRQGGHSIRLNLGRQRVKLLAVPARNSFSKIRSVLEFSGSSRNPLDGSSITTIERVFPMKRFLRLKFDIHDITLGTDKLRYLDTGCNILKDLLKFGHRDTWNG